MALQPPFDAPIALLDELHSDHSQIPHVSRRRDLARIQNGQDTQRISRFPERDRAKPYFAFRLPKD